MPLGEFIDGANFATVVRSSSPSKSGDAPRKRAQDIRRKIALDRFEVHARRRVVLVS